MFKSSYDPIKLVMRYMPESDGKRRPMLITMTKDGEDIRLAIPASEWADKGGSHPTWLPDGEHVMMNLDIDGQGEMFVQARYDGTGLTQMTEVASNRGHPSLHPDERFLITDAYAREDVAFGDGTAPLWLIDRQNATKSTLVRIDAVTKFFDDDIHKTGYMRVDLHPAWDQSGYTRVAFNGVTDGTRRVFVSDLSTLLAGNT